MKMNQFMRIAIEEAQKGLRANDGGSFGVAWEEKSNRIQILTLNF